MLCRGAVVGEEGREAWVGAVGKGVMEAWDVASPVWTEGGSLHRKIQHGCKAVRNLEKSI